MSELSRTLLHCPRAKHYSDVVSFGFFCRKANIEKLKKEYQGSENRVRRGIGTVFHIAPANVPTNFAYSLAVSLLAGNANVVRVPQKEHPQIPIICEAIQRTLKAEGHAAMAERITVVSYGRNDAITAEISSRADGRVIWGGDATIGAIRAIPLPPRAIEVTFADRYSFALIDGDRLVENPGGAEQLARDFYNDTYSMGQGACSSPHLVVWLGQNIDTARDLFWSKLATVAKAKFSLTPVDVVDKYSNLIQDTVDYTTIENCRNYDNFLHVITFGSLPCPIHMLRGKAGYFYEIHIDSLDSLPAMVNPTVQTMTYYGLDKDDLAKFFKSNFFFGIDRAVPVGRALDFSTYWDGYDLIRTLSRAVDIL